MRGKTKTVLFSILLAGLASALAFLFSEYAYRSYLRYRYEKEAAAFSSPLYIIKPHTLIEFSMRPNSSRENRLSLAQPDKKWSYSINADGFRGRNIVHTRAKNKRILFLGDSYTFGWSVNDDQAYPHQLENLLLQNNYDAEIVNLGVPAYNTVQEYQLLCQKLDVYNPDVVILAYVMNDAEPQNIVPLAPEIKYQCASSWLFEDFKLLLYKVHFPFRKTFLRSNTYCIGRNYLEGFEPGSPKWKLSKNALKDIVSFCRKKNITFFVAILPDVTQDFVGCYRWRPIHQVVSKWCEEFGVGYIDLLPYFAGIDHKDFWVAGEGHPNPHAHMRFAQILFDCIRRNALAGPG
ncbi:MAG TPA: SGNH/GDSL hydrolase family protein [Patescibacteria group bacterium]|nr:SGNH/GDSL hydrolase family protein [Patescibacteria group bacterium]